MKTTLLLALLLVAFTATAQDFRAVPPAEQPNAAELAYFGSENPNVVQKKQPDKKAITLVVDFLNDLINGQFETAHRRMADGFLAYGPGYDDKLTTNDLLNQWDRNGKLFADQHLTIESASARTVAAGNNRGNWVYLNVIWSATERKGQPGKPIRIPFHQLTRVNNGLIERTYTSYGNDQLFYDLGFPLYAGPASVVQR